MNNNINSRPPYFKSSEKKPVCRILFEPIDINRPAETKTVQYSHAIPKGIILRMLIRIDRSYAVPVSPEVKLYFEESGINRVIKTEFSGIFGKDEIYKAELSAAEPAFCRMEITAGGIRLPDSPEQLLIYDPEKMPTSPTGGVMYQIFPDRFSKTKNHPVKKKKYTVINKDWDNGIPKYPDKPGDPVDNNDFFGGTLWGIIEKLDYIKSLGITTIYLNPIFDAHTNHKYDTGDYEQVDSMFGGTEALKELIEKAGKLGIGIILDGVFNHTGQYSRYFNAKKHYNSIGAYNSKDSPYYGWYNFKKWPDEYVCWWGVKLLPSINENSGYFDYIAGKNGIIEKYTSMGIAGWRLDVADELTDKFIKSIHSAAKTKNPDCMILGEVWEDASNKIAYDVRKKYLQGGELDSVMNYPLRTAIIELLMHRNILGFVRTTLSIYKNYPKEISDRLMNLLGTHDTVRILNVLSGTKYTKGSLPMKELAVTTLTKQERESARDRLKLAWLICATMYGVPCIYYGDEIGMEGWRDPFCRLPMKWSNIDNDLLIFFRKINAARESIKDFKDGDFDILYYDSEVLVYSRNNTAVAVNVGSHKRLLVFGKPKINALSESLETKSRRFVLRPMTGMILTE